MVSNTGCGCQRWSSGRNLTCPCRFIHGLNGIYVIHHGNVTPSPSSGIAARGATLSTCCWKRNWPVII
ncbi:MAG: hypothetical protein ACXAEU_21960 [Candidatus Hodarchaeales archaeon]